MEPISVFLGVSVLVLLSFFIGFAFGYAFGKQEFQYENLKKSLSNFKKNTFRTLLPREKVVILNSKDSYLPDEDEEQEEHI